MKLWLAEVVELTTHLLCALTGHLGGCAVMRLLDAPHWWAVSTREKALDYPGRHDCPICAKERPSQPVEWETVPATEATATTGSSYQSLTWVVRPKGAA